MHLRGYLLAFAVFFFALTGAAAAHEIRPTIVTASFGDDGRYEIKIAANLEVLLAGIGPEHKDTRESPEARAYDALRSLEAKVLEERFRAFMPKWLSGIDVSFDGVRASPVLERIEIPAVGNVELPRLSTLYLTGHTPAGTPVFRWRYDRDFGSSVLRVKGDSETKMSAYWLKDGSQSEAIPVTGAMARSGVDVFLQYLTLGFTHIVPLGVDHILFVLGLYLLSTQFRPLLIQVTAFTLAHSVTLGLGLYGIIAVSPMIVEPLIAASIVFVAVENMMTQRLTPWRPYVVFGFGLLHGLGFAGVLHEIGLAREDFVNGLIAFNIGVELGQLAVILGAFLLTGLWFRDRPWYRGRIVLPTSALIGAAGAYWMVERVL